MIDEGDRIVSAGLQHERTRLSWDRTALSFAAFGGLLTHLAHGMPHPDGLVLGVATMGAGLAVYVIGRRRYRQRVSQHMGDALPCRPKALAVVTAITVVTTVLAGLQAFLPH